MGDRYELVRRARGKETLVETGSLSRIRADAGNASGHAIDSIL